MPDDHTPFKRLDSEELNEFPDVRAEFGGGGEYHYTDRELEEAGFTIRDLGDMPEHESDFIPDPARHLAEQLECSPSELREIMDRFAFLDCLTLGRLVEILTTPYACTPWSVAGI
jgi:hypothetical protein